MDAHAMPASFQNVRGQMGCCGIWCGSCIVANGALNALAREFEAILDGYDILTWGANDFDPGEFRKGLASLQSLPSCPGCARGGGRKDCALRACAEGYCVSGCTECVQFTGCPHAGLLRHMREGAEAAGLFVLSPGELAAPRIERWTESLKGRFPGSILWDASVQRHGEIEEADDPTPGTSAARASAAADMLVAEAVSAYAVTAGLIRRVDDSELSWRPPLGNDWMTMAQLLMHCASFACGKAIRGFVRGDWGTPDPASADHLPRAGELPEVASRDEALALLENDRLLTMECLMEAGESPALFAPVTAPWGGAPLPLFRQLLMMIQHLVQHKGQLYYYLKLMGKDVSTPDLWGNG